MNIELLQQVIRQAGYVREGNLFVHHSLPNVFPVTEFFPNQKPEPVVPAKAIDKPDCSEHKKEVAGISDMKVLAEMIGDLHYETFSEFLLELHKKLQIDLDKDKASERLQLAYELKWASIFINCASHHIKKSWELSKPFMQK